MLLDIAFETDNAGLQVFLAADEEMRSLKARIRTCAAVGGDFALMLKVVAYPWLDSKCHPGPQGRYSRSNNLLDRESGRAFVVAGVHATIWIEHAELVRSSSALQTARLVGDAVMKALELPALHRRGVDIVRLRQEVAGAVATQ